MKTIGLLGGMSWESTVLYYQLINQATRATLGGLNSAPICLYSVNFAKIEQLQHNNEWHAAAAILSQAATSVVRGGADFLLICTNTMHKVAPEIEQAITVPVLHIADATAQVLLDDNIQRIGLLGTRFTMQQDFYKNRLTDKFGLDVIVPNDGEQQIIHNIIYNELCQGIIKQTSRQSYLNIINQLVKRGAQGVILGCTEITLLIKETDAQIKLYDTTHIHAIKAVDYALT